MTKTFTDTWGDKLQVIAYESGGNVYVNNTAVARRNDRLTVDFSFTAAEARLLAKALKKAAKRAEAAQ